MNNEEEPLSFLTSLRRTRHGNVGDVAERLADIHNRLRGAYSTYAREASAERLTLALETLAEMEGEMVKNLQQFQEDAADTVLLREFKYVPDLNGDELFEAMEIRQPRDSEDLVDLLQEIHKSIDAVYAPLDGSSLPEEVDEAVEKLRLQEREHAIEQMRAVTDE